MHKNGNNPTMNHPWIKAYWPLLCITLISSLTGNVEPNFTSSFIVPTKCFQKETGIFQCIARDINTEFEDVVRTVIPNDAVDLTIFCTYPLERRSRAMSLTHLKKLRSIQFWRCKMGRNPLEKVTIPHSIRSMVYHDLLLSDSTEFISTSILCKIGFINSIAITYYKRYVLDCDETSCCSGLTALNLSHNKIDDIALNSFHGAYNLETLDLSGNDIKSFENEVFSNLTSLMTLNLTGNPLVTLDLRIFKENAKLLDLVLDFEFVMMTMPDSIEVYPVIFKRDVHYCSVFTNVDFKKHLFLKNLRTLCIPSKKNYGDRIVPYSAYLGDMFANLVNLSTVQIQLNKDGLHLPKHLFESLHILQTLIISSETRIPVDILSQLLYDYISPLKELEKLQLNLGLITGLELNLSKMSNAIKNIPNLKYFILDYSSNWMTDNFFEDLNHLEIVSVRNVGIKTSPSSICNSGKLRELDLGENQISAVNTLANCSELESVYLDSNLLSYIGNPLFTPFQGLMKLKKLVIPYNNIEDFDFCSIPNSLEYLDLTGNKILHISDVQNLSRSLNLQVILLWENKITFLDPNILPSSLRQFAISQKEETDDTIHIGKFNFDKLDHMEIFIFQAENINQLEVERGFLRNFHSRNDLYIEFALAKNLCCPKCFEIRKTWFLSFKEDLGKSGREEYNIVYFFDRSASRYMFCASICTCVKKIRTPLETSPHECVLDCGYSGLRDYPEEKISFSPFETVLLDGNNISIIKKFYGMSNNVTKKIHLNNSRVSVVHREAFKLYTYLEELHLENNALTTLQFEVEVRGNRLRVHNRHLKLFLQGNNITTVDIRNNCGDRDCDIYLEWLPLENHRLSVVSAVNLCAINLQNNNIDSLNSSVFKLCTNITTIDLSFNLIQEVPLIKLLPNTTVNLFDLSHNVIEAIDSQAFVKFAHLKILNLYENLIAILKGTEFTRLKSLETLDLGNNKINSINQNVFVNIKHLNKLNLANNRLKVVKYQFEGLYSLRELYLNGNQLSTLKNEDFQGLEKLKVLHLHNNHLKFVAMTVFANLQNLETMTLNDNKLKTPNMWELPKKLSFLNMTNNSLTCNCKFMVEFRKWLAEIRDTNLNFTISSLTCFSDVHEEVPVLQFDLALCRISYEIVLSVCVGILFLLFLTVSAMYYWRTEVQVWVYSRYGVRLFYDVEEDNSKAFDVFISFSNDDARFVVQQLVPGLVEYKVCVHYKHFPPGAYIADSIVEAVAESRRTLLVFSKNFMKSGYCKFEFRAAHQKSLEDRCCRLIVVLLEDVDEKNMDPEMKAYFRTNTFLRWDDPVFWKKLYFALPDLKIGANDQQILVDGRQNVIAETAF